jgi:hypothetical protein
MKKLLIILGVVLVATAMITSCGDPGEEGAIWTVTFDSDGGDPIPAKQVENGNSVPEPTSYFKAYTPTAAGFYPASLKVKEWQKADGKKFDFTKETITSDITLKAIWENPTAIVPTLPAQGNIVEKAIKYTNDNVDSYILALGENITASATETISSRYAKLTIIGVTDEKTITFSGTGTYITVGAAADDSTIGLTLGKNIKLIGKAANNKALLVVKNQATLTVDGATITGNTSTATTPEDGQGAAAINVNKGVFIMKSGSITTNTNGNQSSNATSNYRDTAGAVVAQNGAKLTLSGGSIKNNTNEDGTQDVYVTSNSTITVSGTIEVGELCLSRTGNETSKVTVSDAAFNGNIKINLRVPDSTGANDTANSWWKDKEIVTGVNATTLAKFSVGNFIRNISTGGNALISNTYKIDATGKLVTK